MPKLITPLVALLVFVLAGGAAAADNDVAAREHTVRFTLAASNVQNFFDAFDDPYTQDETAWPKRRNESVALGKVLERVDADFLGVEEIENEGILVRFRGWNLAGRGYDYHYCAQSLGSRGINNALLSRIPVRPITVHKYERFTRPGDDSGHVFTFARHPVQATLHPAADVTVTVIIVHLKSKRTVYEDDPQAAHWRTAEAIHLRAMVDARLEADPDAMIAVIGDFNDTPDSAPIRALLAPAPGSTPGGDGRPALIDPHKDIPADRSITYLRDPYKARIDYILLTPALAKHVVPDSAKIYNEGEIGSDHAPVAVTLAVPTAQADARAHWPTGEPEREVRTFFKKQREPAPAGAE